MSEGNGNGLTSKGGVFIPQVVESVKPDKFLCAVCAPERRARGEDPVGFKEDEMAKYERHVARCASDHEEQLRAQSPSAIENQMGEGDSEFEGWVRRNRMKLIEGRKKI